MNGNILRILLKKEVAQIRRSFLMRYVIFVMPVLVMLVIPLVTTLDVKNVDVVVVDNDRTELSRRIVADMDAAECLSVVGCFFLLRRGVPSDREKRGGCHSYNPEELLERLG